MKIGILTFHFSINYGAVIQVYALALQLRKMGHSTHVVNYELNGSRWPWILGALRSGLHDGFRRFRQQLPFRMFRMKYLRQTRRIRDIAQLRKGEFDAIIVGSDQVWNPIYACSDQGEFNTVYFLEGLAEGCRRISYAASMGEADWGRHWSKVRSLLQRFRAISVRENYAQKVLTEHGVSQVELVSDPSIFLAEGDLDALIGKSPEPRGDGCRYFVYGLGEAERCSTELVSRLKGEGDLAHVVVMRACTTIRDARVTYVKPSPIGWVAEIRAADFIITDSFHCMMVALAYHKPFKMIYKTLEPMTNDRMLTILKVAGMDDTENPDWEDVDKRLAAYREVGLRYLSNALKSDTPS